MRARLETFSSVVTLIALTELAGCASAPTTAPLDAQPMHTAPPIASAQPDAGPPVADKKPVVDTYHGVSVTDDYRWLENGDDPAVKAWSSAENAFTRRTLDALPGREALATKLKGIIAFESPDWYRAEWRGKRLFAMKEAPPKQQALLVVMKGPNAPDKEQVIVDPNVIDPAGGTTIDWYVPSLDGKLVAVSLSVGGSESGTVHVYDVDGGKEHPADTIPRVHGGTAGGSLAWLADGSGFFYTRYPAPSERPAADLGFYQELWFHKLGADTKTDVASLNKSLPKIAEIVVKTSDDGRFALASVANGDGGEFDQWVLDLGKDKKKPVLDKWRHLATLADKVVEARFAPDSELWLRSLKDAPKGKIMKLGPSDALEKAKVVVPESDAVIDEVLVTPTRVFTADLVGGPYQVRVFDRKGKQLSTLPLEPVSSVWRLEPLEGDDVLLRTESYVTAPSWQLYRDKDAKLTPTKLVKQSPVKFDDIEVVRETCTSKDGTKVPLNIMRKKGLKLDGSSPLLLTGYGGYAVSESPWYDARVRVWMDAGGVFADANIRGGGEFGEAWHHAGNLTKKQNVFDDFLACAKHVVEAGYTKPDRLAIIGGSNGGLLMGAALTQAPEMFKAVVSMVGIYDMLRVELTPNGAFNVTEFGTVKDKSHFDAMMAYSPFHHVKDGTQYPAVLFMTGANDPRVDPFHSRKMVARMQASGTKAPVLLRTSDNTGHGMGTPLDAQVAEQVDVWGFLLDEVVPKGN
jgi:prolyl oligopeptidase